VHALDREEDGDVDQLDGGIGNEIHPKIDLSAETGLCLIVADRNGYKMDALRQDAAGIQPEIAGHFASEHGLSPSSVHEAEHFFVHESQIPGLRLRWQAGRRTA
jgi:hypothetical protein